MSVTMPRPGSAYRIKNSPPPRTIPTDTGTWFVAGLSDRGPLTPQKIVSLTDATNKLGSRQSYSILMDALELYFRDGGGLAYVSRVVGPAAAVASLNLLDAGAAVSLVATAKGPGAYGNSITIQRQNPGAGGLAGSFSLLVTDPNYPGGQISEQSPDFTTQAAAIAWAQQSQLINLALGASANLPANAAAAPMAGGADDRAAITDAQWAAALTRFPKDLGPGQVTQIGRTTPQAHSDTLAHANANNRKAILDLPDSPTPATVQAGVLRGNANDTEGAAFAPWIVIPGLAGPGTTRIVPPSALVAAKIAASDSSGNSPNVPAAGFPEGVSDYAIGLSQPAYDNGAGIDVTRDAMYSAGVNQIVSRFGLIEVFGWRTLTDKFGANGEWINFANARLKMAIIAEGMAILENYILDEIDGRGRTFGRLQGQIQAICGRYYGLGSLYDGGSGRAEDSYVVDTGPNVNTPETIAAQEIHVSVAARMTQDGELVVFDFAKVPVTQSLAA
jgi:hypothetical protein